MHFDKDFIKKLKQQDHHSFNTFYLETVDIFYRYLDSNYGIKYHDAEDIVSDFYIRFREHLHQYKEDQSFSGYMWTIFKNLTKDYFKKNTDIPFTHLDSENDENLHFEDILLDDSDMTSFLEQDFQLQILQTAMTDLDDASKDIIHWKFIEQKSNEELELLLGLSQDTLRQRLSRAIKQLKSILPQS